MDTPALVILICTGAVFVAGLVWLLTWGRRWRFPPGTHYVATYNGFRCTLITREKLPNAQAVANAGARAAFCLFSAWPRRFAGDTAPESLRHVAINIRDDASYDRTSLNVLRPSNAHLVLVGRLFSSVQLPMAVVRAKYVGKIIDQGEPVIHELCHALQFTSTQDRGDYGVHDYQHKDPDVWVIVGGEVAVQAIARELYKALA